MANAELMQIESTWPSLAAVLFVPHSDRDYERLVETLDQLIDIVGENEFHPLASLMEVVGVLVERYEDEHVPEITEVSD